MKYSEIKLYLFSYLSIRYSGLSIKKYLSLKNYKNNSMFIDIKNCIQTP